MALILVLAAGCGEKPAQTADAPLPEPVEHVEKVTSPTEKAMPKVELDPKAAEWVKQTENNRHTAEWIQKTSQYLRKFRPSDSTPEMELERASGIVKVHVAHGKTPQLPSWGCCHGLVKFAEDDWVYLMVLSRHAMYSNVVLAVDADNNLYKTYTHVCPFLGLLLPENGELKSSRDFFRTTTFGGPDNRTKFPWVKVTPGA